MTEEERRRRALQAYNTTARIGKSSAGPTFTVGKSSAGPQFVIGQSSGTGFTPTIGQSYAAPTYTIQGDNGRKPIVVRPTGQVLQPTPPRDSGLVRLAQGLGRGLAEPFQATSRGLVTALGGNRQTAQELDRSIRLRNSAMEQYTRDYRSGKITSERYRALMASNNTGVNVEGENARLISDASPRRFVAGVADLGLTAATVGVGGSAFKAARKGAPIIGRQVAREIGTGAALGSSAGLVGSFEGEYAPTAKQVVTNTALGTVIGGAIPASGAVLGKSKVGKLVTNTKNQRLATRAGVDYDVAQYIAKAKDENEIANLLTGLGQDYQAASRVAARLAKTTDESEIIKLLGNIPQITAAGGLTAGAIRGGLRDIGQEVAVPPITRLPDVPQGTVVDTPKNPLSDLDNLNNADIQINDGTRAAHQTMLEAAHNAGDVRTVRNVIDSLPDSDPYKASMISTFADDIQKAGGLTRSQPAPLRSQAPQGEVATQAQKLEDAVAPENMPQAAAVPITPGPGRTTADIAQGRASNAVSTPTQTQAVQGVAEAIEPTGIDVVPTNQSGLRSQIKQALIDDDAVILDELRNIEKQTGQKGLVDRFMYLSGLQKRANSIAVKRFQNAPEIQDAFGGLSKPQANELNTYAAARRELANARQGLPTSQPIEDLQAIVDDLAPNYEARFNSLRDYYFSLADDLRNAGIIDQTKYDQFVSDPDYIRLQRDFEDIFQRGQAGGRGYSLGSSLTSKKRTGSQRDVLPADLTALDYTQRIQNEIQRNQTATGLIDMLSLGNETRKVTQKQAVRNNVLKRLVDGKPEFFEVSQDIKRVAENIAPYQLNILQRIIGAPARTFRAGTTALNPVFTVYNFTRDQLASAILNKDARATSKYFMSGLYNATKDTFADNNEPLWQKYISYTGDTTSYDLTRNIKNTKQVVSEVRGGVPRKYGNALLHPIRSLEDLNAITERATRFQNFKGIYNKSLKNGATEGEALQEATLAAWQTTVDFNRAGEWGRTLNLVIPYFNAGIQGSRQLFRATKARPLATTAKGTLLVGTPLAAATLWNLSDPERAAIYANIPDYEKENNVVLIPPGAKQNKDGSYDVLKIPMPPGITNLYQPFRRGTEAFASDNPIEAEVILKDITKAFSGPVNTSADTPAQFASGFLPQAVKPAVQAVANKDFYTGKDIVPDYMQGAAPENQAYSYTSGTARKVGEALGVSPVSVQKFVGDTFGKVGQYTLNTSDNALAKAGVISEDQIGGQSVGAGLVAKFTKAPGIENFEKSEGAKFFDNREKSTKGLNANEMAAFNAIYPSKTDFEGNKLNDKTYYDQANKASTYLRYPKVFEAAKKLDQAQNGKNGDPLFKLDRQKQQVVLNLQALSFSPGNREAEAITKLNPWLQDYYDQRSSYYDKIAQKQTKAQKAAAGIDPMGLSVPIATKSINQKFDQLGNISDPAERANFYAENPDLTEYFTKQDLYRRAKREFMGLPQFDRYPTAPPEVQKLMDFYSSLPKNDGPKGGNKTRSQWINSHPAEWAALTDQWSKTAMYTLQDQASLAVYEGIDIDEKGIKAIKSLAQSLGVTDSGGGSGGSKGYYDKSGKWVRTGGKNPTTTGNMGLSKLLGDVTTSVKAPDVNTKPTVRKLQFRIPKRASAKTRVKLQS